MIAVTVYFFARRGVASWLTRWFTQRRNQPFAVVPSHCGISVTENGKSTYYEAIVSGVKSEPLLSVTHLEKAQWVEVSVLDVHACAAFLDAQVGKPYDWSAILLDVFGVGTPRWVQIKDLRTDKWDCSRLVMAALNAGSLMFETAHLPESPNDLLIDLISR